MFYKKTILKTKHLKDLCECFHSKQIQSAITRSKLAIVILEQCVKYVQS